MPFGLLHPRAFAPDAAFGPWLSVSSESGSADGGEGEGAGGGGGSDGGEGSGSAGADDKQEPDDLQAIRTELEELRAWKKQINREQRNARHRDDGKGSGSAGADDKPKEFTQADFKAARRADRALGRLEASEAVTPEALEALEERTSGLGYEAKAIAYEAALELIGKVAGARSRNGTSGGGGSPPPRNRNSGHPSSYAEYLDGTPEQRKQWAREGVSPSELRDGRRSGS